MPVFPAQRVGAKAGAAGGPEAAVRGGGEGKDKGSERGGKREGFVETAEGRDVVGVGVGGEGEGGDDGEGAAGRPRLLAMKALAGFPWPAPPSLCHPGNAAAASVVHAMACLEEEEGQATLVSALERWAASHATPLWANVSCLMAMVETLGGLGLSGGAGRSQLTTMLLPR